MRRNPLMKYLALAALLCALGALCVGCSGVTRAKMAGVKIETPFGSLTAGVDQYDATRPEVTGQDETFNFIPLEPEEPEPEETP